MAELKSNQEQAAYLIATGSSCKDVAEVVGVTPETISHWKNSPIFTARSNEYKQEVVDSLREGIRSLSIIALTNLKELIENAESESVKLRACIEVLKMQGLSDPERWGWGIGYKTAKEVEEAPQQAELYSFMSMI